MSQAACELLRTMLSHCAKWQSLCGAMGQTAAAQAAAKVHLFGRAGEPELPAAYIRTETDAAELQGEGFFYGTGELHLEIELPGRPASSLAAEYGAVQTDWDELREQLLALAQVPPNLRVVRWTSEPIALAQDVRKMKFWVLAARLTWS